MKYLPILLLALLTACGRSQEEIKAESAASLANPQIVGQTPDGQNIYHSTIRVTNSSYEQHLFFIGSAVTDNTREAEGKSDRSKVTAVIHSVVVDPDVVVIHGVHYDVKEVEAALTRDEDQRRKQLAESHKQVGGQ